MTPAAARAAARRQFAAHGEDITLRRVNAAPAAPTDVVVRGRVRGYTPEEIASGINQGDREVRLLAESVEASGFPLPIKSGSTDRVVLTSRPVARVMMIGDIDDSSSRVGSTLIQYKIRATG